MPVVRVSKLDAISERHIADIEFNHILTFLQLRHTIHVNMYTIKMLLYMSICKQLKCAIHLNHMNSERGGNGGGSELP